MRRCPASSVTSSHRELFKEGVRCPTRFLWLCDSFMAPRVFGRGWREPASLSHRWALEFMDLYSHLVPVYDVEPLRRSLMPTRTSTYGTKLTSAACSHPGSSLQTQNHLPLLVYKWCQGKLSGVASKEGRYLNFYIEILIQIAYLVYFLDAWYQRNGVDVTLSDLTLLASNPMNGVVLRSG